MSVENASLQKAPTSFTVVGGTAEAFTEDGVEIPSGVHLAAADVTDFRIRPTITLKTRNPRLVNGIFTKAKRTLTFVQPALLADESVVYNIVRMDVEIHPELSVAASDEIIAYGAQMLIDADFQSFLRTGSLA